MFKNYITWCWKYENFFGSFNKKLNKDIKNYLKNGGMIYGICLGMQLLLKKNESRSRTIGIIGGAGVQLEKNME